MSVRREPTYLSTDVWGALLLIARGRGKHADIQGFVKSTTPDEIADEYLREAIREKDPDVVELQKKIAKMRDEFIKARGGEP